MDAQAVVQIKTGRSLKIPELSWIIILTLLALLLRLIGLGDLSYWFDEAREVLRAMTPWPEVLSITDGADPPFYRLLIHPIAQITTSEFWLRLPSALFSAASVYLVYRWLVELKLERVGLVAAVFMAVMPVQIHYAQEVSQYSLVVFLTLLLLWAFARVTKRGKPGDWVFLSLATVVSFYTYYGLAWLLPILVLDLAWHVWHSREKVQIIRFFIYHLVVFASLTILYFSMIQLHINRFTTNKQLTSLFVQPGIWQSLRSLDNKLVNGFVKFFVTPYSQNVPNWFIWLFVVLALVGMVVLLFQGSNGRRINIFLWGTITTTYIAHGLGYYPFDGRYILFAMPFFVALLGAAIAVLWPHRWLAWSLTGMLVMALALFWPIMPDSINKWRAWVGEEMRPAMAYLNTQANADDFVYVYYGAKPAYGVYQKDATYPTAYGTWFRNSETIEKVAEIQSAVAQSPRFWLVMTHIHADEDEVLIAELSKSYSIVDIFIDRGVVIVLFSPTE
jgi:4-amino-4-deoxy-L-arabinose transferase-like glycosyltransferase